jgi:acetolactate synthase I/II/III large subunit
VIKLSDYVTAFLVERGVKNVFLVSGGGIMHLLDSVGRESRLNYICNHHEQASAIAAESEARLTKRPGVCIATTGPGATNALSGAVGAFYDSIPMLVLSGQVRTQLISDYAQLRQMGPQEVNISEMARPVTKYVKTVRDPHSIRYELEKAWALSQEGRPGPAWLDLPLDVQATDIDEESLVSYDEEQSALVAKKVSLAEEAHRILGAIHASKRPLLLAGNGIHIGGGEQAVLDLIDHLGIPTVASVGGADLLPDNHPLFFGRIGPIGQRRANFALQNSDLLIAVGASLCLASIGFNTAAFAPGAKKYLVNVDPGELAKRTIQQEPGVLADAGEFAEALQKLAPHKSAHRPSWQAACEGWKSRYPILADESLMNKEKVSPYVFANQLGSLLDEGDVVVTGNSMDWWALYQAFPLKKDQRLYTNLNYGAMGWDLPAAIGACLGRKGRRTVLVTGDGGIQTNIHELGTIGFNRLPVKIFVFSNEGYQSIRATQDNFFNGRYVGSGSTSGVGVPDFEAVARAYGLRFCRMRANDEIKGVAEAMLSHAEPHLCEVMVSPTQERLPRVRSYRRADGQIVSPSLEDMFPPLPPEEIADNMRFSREDI